MKFRIRAALVSVSVAVACACAAPVAAEAAFESEPGGFTVRTSIHGVPNNQAGAHADVTTSFAFTRHEEGSVDGIVRNVEVVFPVGFAGYPADVKTCTPVELQLEACPADSQVGLIEVALRFEASFTNTLTYPVYNMAPLPDETAVFGFVVAEFVSGGIVLSVGPDYRVHAKAANVISVTEIVRQSLTVWGVPADASHTPYRGKKYHCYQHNAEEKHCIGGGVEADENPVPFLVNPTQCTPVPPTAELNVESWEGEKAPTTTDPVGPFTGCESLKFAPTLSVEPERNEPTTPTGYAVDLTVPQTEGAEGFATADLKDVTVTMPEGVVLSPSAANGLEVCTEEQLGMEEGVPNAEPIHCPSGSKIGTVSVVTPALTGELKGFLYLGGPPSGPITHPPFTVYLTLAGHGVLVKVRGTVMPNPATGQLTTTFDENPELPFSELKLLLNGGPRATVANPSVCGPYHAESELTPWTWPAEATVTQPSFPFEIGPCLAPRFNPAFAVSTLSNQAGGYSTLRVDFSREDGDGHLGGLTVTMPPGLSGNLSKIPLCPEPQAALGTCSTESQIGELTAGAGPGPQPYFIKGGRVFLTGPYKGAPFGLSIDVPENAGPLDLGTGPCDCEVVRAAVSVDPHTAQLTVSNGALPTGKYGIPFQVRQVNVDINRPEFVFNPTSCNAMTVAGTLSSVEGATAPVSSHFQATNCAALSFKPTFHVSTSAHTSRLRGASLTAKLSFPKAPQGTEENIARVKVELPRQLPSRLKTLQKACKAATFEANPALCPAASVVGHAKAVTPILPVPLEGPAYFVSHGGEAFPSLIVVLQGYGVTVDLEGTTFISKHGITSTTFKTVPDVPVGTFTLTLPEGPASALAATGNLCRSHKLKMPVEFVAQDNRTVWRTIPIAVTGCPHHRAR